MKLNCIFQVDDSESDDGTESSDGSDMVNLSAAEAPQACPEGESQEVFLIGEEVLAKDYEEW